MRSNARRSFYSYVTRATFAVLSPPTHHLLRSHGLAVDETLEARSQETEGDQGADGHEGLVSALREGMGGAWVSNWKRCEWKEIELGGERQCCRCLYC